jgi:signal peptidase I
MVQPPESRTSRAGRARVRHARRRVLTGFGVAGAVMVLAASAVLTVCVFTLHLGIRPVLTGSMRPDYGPGAVLITERVPTSSLRPGMIVLFVPPGESAQYAHRITTVTGSPDDPVITTKGDANKASDPWHARINATEINKVIGSVPAFGRILVVVRGPGQIILALAGAAIALWAGSRWLASSSSRRPRRRATTGGVIAP